MLESAVRCSSWPKPHASRRGGVADIRGGGAVEGGLQTRKWTGKDGNERYTTEIVLPRFRGELTMLDSRSGGGSGEGSGGGDFGGERSASPATSSGSGGGDFDDEIPF